MERHPAYLAIGELPEWLKRAIEDSPNIESVSIHIYDGYRTSAISWRKNPVEYKPGDKCAKKGTLTIE